MRSELVTTSRKRDGLRHIVRARMESIGLTPQEVARLAGLPQSRVSEFLTGSVNVGVRTAEAIIRACDGEFRGDHIEWTK